MTIAEATHRATTATTNRFIADPSALPRNDFAAGTGSGGLWGNQSQWKWNWKQYPAGKSLNFVSAPLASNTVAIGGGRVEFWARSSQRDVDLVATVSEIDPKGNETFVQNGYLRASKRALSTTSDNFMKTPSTLLEPVLSFKESDIADMPADAFTKLVVPLYFSGHPYRAGTRIKVSLAAPNGTQPIWAFDHTEPATGTETVDVLSDATHPSRLVLPVVSGVTIKTVQPRCGVLRNQPCRPYVAQANTVVH